MKLTNYLLYSLVLFMAIFSSCKDEAGLNNTLEQGEGEVAFRFFARNVYTINDINDIARLSVTLRTTGETAESIELPIVDVTKDGEEMVSENVAVAAGTYEVEKYVAYDVTGEVLHEAIVRNDNVITVVEGELINFYFPVSILSVESTNLMMNKLFGICIEVLGADSTLWPKTWREENDDLLSWENLEFETDDYGNISYLAGIIFDEKFAGMKKLPSTLSRIITLESIVVNNIPEFEEIPEDLDLSSLQSLTVINTSLKSIPQSLQMPSLYKMTIINSKLTEFPKVNHLESLEQLTLRENDITEIPEDAFKSLSNRALKIDQLRIQKTKISKLPANLFVDLPRVYTFDLRSNSELSQLPTSYPSGDKISALLLDSCAFTVVPAEAVKNLKIGHLSMEKNKLTALDLSAFGTGEENTLEILNVSDNPITSFSNLNSSILTQLSLSRCGLREIPDLRGLTNLRMLELSHNNITKVDDNEFKSNEALSVIDLSYNTSLATVPSSGDFGMYTKNYIYGNTDAGTDEGTTETAAEGETGTEETVHCTHCTHDDGSVHELATETSVNNVPVNLRSLNLDGCSSLTWEVPSSWCCVQNVSYIGGKGTLVPLANRPVIVYNREASGVTYAPCWHEVEGKKTCPYRLKENNYQLKFRETFAEIWEELHKEK